MNDYRDADWLREQYVERGRTQRGLAEACDVTPRTIRRWMNRHGIETRDVAGENHGLYGRERDDEVRARISESMRGREFDAETRERLADAKRGTTVPDDVRERIGDSLAGRSKSAETRRRMSEGHLGHPNPEWENDGSPLYGAGWADAREYVRNRDEVCQHCGGDGSEYDLEVHHLVPVRLFRVWDRPDVSDAHAHRNLVLLCQRCHVKAEHGLIDVERVERPL